MAGNLEETKSVQSIGPGNICKVLFSISCLAFCKMCHDICENIPCSSLKTVFKFSAIMVIGYVVGYRPI